MIEFVMSRLPTPEVDIVKHACDTFQPSETLRLDTGVKTDRF